MTERPRVSTGGRQYPSLRARTEQFAARIVRLYRALPRKDEAQVVGNQLLRSGTAVGAHYREATRARSTAEFISKIHCGLQELEETRYWLAVLRDSAIIPWPRLANLDAEADQLIAILITVVRNAKRRAAAKQQDPQGRKAQ